jgi:hypothetical protein
MANRQDPGWQRRSVVPVVRLLAAVMHPARDEF